MTAQSHEQGPKGFWFYRNLTSLGDRLRNNQEELVSIPVHAVAIVAGMVEGAGHVVGVTGRAVARSLRRKEY